MLVVIQVSAEGLYLPPVFSEPLLLSPPHTIISLPVQTAACLSLASGALIVLVTVQVSVAGTYLPPLLPVPPVASSPPQMTISVPVHTAVCSTVPRADSRHAWQPTCCWQDRTFRHCSTHLVHRRRSFRFRSIRPYDRFARRVRL